MGIETALVLFVASGFLTGTCIANLVILNEVEKNLATETSTPTKKTVNNMYAVNVFVLIIGVIIFLFSIIALVLGSRREIADGIELKEIKSK